ncbi:unnamed protein product [Paramecium octaurelia]|uniref:non-specific serine/threonine protein kinase n=1 Tax=Paramecium octaurelia TaxID=43137 RepID=A0A8S1TV26_PAROT|nr:unnamed protein product [Paramecium octaurelia]
MLHSYYKKKQNLAKLVNRCNKNGIHIFDRLRLFNQEGVEITEDDLYYMKNGSVILPQRVQFKVNIYYKMKNQMKVFNLQNFMCFKILEKQFLLRFFQIDTKKQEKKSSNQNGQIIIDQCLIKIYDGFFMQNFQMLFIMEYLQIGQLQQYLQTKGKFEEIGSCYFILPLKENNSRRSKIRKLLLISKDLAVIKFIGLGISSLTSTDNPENTDKNYLKVGRDKTVSPLADVWSMGVVLYGMLVETLPFNANTKQEIIAQISKARLMIPKNLILNYLEITKIAYTHSRTRSQKENYFN